jgi:biotin carboxyl carrier protein
MSRIDVGGRTRSLEVRRAAGGFEVTIDGRRVSADLARSPSGWSLLLDARSYDIAVDEQAGGTTVHVNGLAIPVFFEGAARRLGGNRGIRDAANGPWHVASPMAGRVVKVLVKPGDTVEARQGLVVVEAMKMENEIRAPGPGTVREVRVAAGAPVDASAVLVVIA